jgi:hypothetical protein
MGLDVKTVDCLVGAQSLGEINLLVAAIIFRVVFGFLTLELLGDLDVSSSILEWSQLLEFLEVFLDNLLFSLSNFLEKRLVILDVWVVTMATTWYDQSLDIQGILLHEPVFIVLNFLALHFCGS